MAKTGQPEMETVQLLWTIDRVGTLSSELGGCRATVRRLLPGLDTLYQVHRLNNPSIALASGRLPSTRDAMLAAAGAIAAMQHSNEQPRDGNAQLFSSLAANRS